MLPRLFICHLKGPREHISNKAVSELHFLKVQHVRLRPHTEGSVQKKVSLQVRRSDLWRP